LLCKLAYFCLDIVSRAVDSASEELPYDAFKQETKDSFSHWFPASAWGDEKFEISYDDGPLSVSIVRTSRRGKLGDKIRLGLGQAFCSAYESALKDISELRERTRSKKSKSEEVRPWEIRELASKRMGAIFEEGRSFYQIYIPAGRALFTTYSKAIKAFQSGSLDPVTSRFGEMAEWLFNDRIYFPEKSSSLIKAFDEIQDRVLKGRLHYKRDIAQFDTEDGRTLSLAHLSSGTQEALPLLRALRMTLPGPESQTVFAEEPEAHLFPSAQLEIVKLFCWLANAHQHKSCFVITTHSPYILTAFNEMIKAGQTAAQYPGKIAEVERVIPRRNWVSPDDFAAYAFDGKDGVLHQIMDTETQLIDGDVLDSISSLIGSQFERLLEIQYAEK